MAVHLLSIALEFLTKHHISEDTTRGYRNIECDIEKERKGRIGEAEL